VNLTRDFAEVSFWYSMARQASSSLSASARCWSVARGAGAEQIWMLGHELGQLDWLYTGADLLRCRVLAGRAKTNAPSKLRGFAAAQ
jgi:hypothetical protein